MKKLMLAIVLLVVSHVPFASAQELCVDTSINSSQFVIKVTGVSDNLLSLALNRDDLSNPYAAYGSMAILPDLANPTRIMMSWEYQFQNGQVGYYCDISLLFPTSNASVTTIVGGLTPSTSHGTCRLFSCNPSAVDEE